MPAVDGQHQSAPGNGRHVEGSRPQGLATRDAPTLVAAISVAASERGSRDPGGGGGRRRSPRPPAAEDMAALREGALQERNLAAEEKLRPRECHVPREEINKRTGGWWKSMPCSCVEI